ncbi:MAG: hypothetical protein F2785_01355, partial [Actinobacteria bacterium]|nr:hypothetical protein [Actinomycetota bacterium]
MSSANPETFSRDVVQSGRVESILDYASPSRPLYFRSGDREIVGIGEHTRWTASGPNRFATLARLWDAAVAVAPPAMRPYLHAIGSGSFDPNGEAFLIFPRVTIIRRGREITTVTAGSSGTEPENVRRTIGPVPVVDWPHIDSVYRDRVRTALGR